MGIYLGQFISPKAWALPGILLAILLIVFRHRVRVATLKELFFTKQSAEMAWMVFGIIAFSKFLNDSGAALQLAEEFHKTGLPLVLIVMLLPFVAGLVSGITVAFVGSSFPIIVSLLTAAVVPELIPAYITLAFVFGFMGVMISPVHLCIILTSQYFEVPMAKLIKKIAPPTIMMMVAVTIWFLCWL
jgi:hypothetical protein